MHRLGSEIRHHTPWKVQPNCQILGIFTQNLLRSKSKFNYGPYRAYSLVTMHRVVVVNNKNMYILHFYKKVIKLLPQR